MSSKLRALEFELGSGALCLDLANTWGDRGSRDADQLRSYGDLLAFSRQAGLLEAGEARRLAGRARREASRAAAAFSRAIELRETAFRILSALVGGERPADEDVGSFNRILTDAMRTLQVSPRKGGFIWSWSASEESLEAPLWPIARSAAELLTGDALDRVRQCDGRRCNWLFLDRSRNRSRRWCSMTVCGNRAKARRHYRRKKDG